MFFSFLFISTFFSYSSTKFIMSFIFVNACSFSLELSNWRIDSFSAFFPRSMPLIIFSFFFSFFFRRFLIIIFILGAVYFMNELFINLKFYCNQFKYLKNKISVIANSKWEITSSMVFSLNLSVFFHWQSALFDPIGCSLI